ncbi:hypothetical protein [Campylobacter corcagiensis]|uniref:Uncharacterized protein n=1 Tax=Campylobacter corcagiensis TaxID=1448857 RepID=A0A7M1LG02_9BACT|nr:hypothetical protein [Campylobacter corcagiensis]QKF64325.1 hypothetical protein CCORG_0451 [Campylobacter corcagiensis]QOQ87488.1 hypothetical protein IMC76_01315 [Campylobacter corcagiensis]
MKFEKKVIIGSITSFIITAVGIVAVFFPDLFNLQKEKVISLTMDINTQEDVSKFQDFLLQRAKDGKIFKLDVCMPDFLWTGNGWSKTYVGDKKPAKNQPKNISHDFLKWYSLEYSLENQGLENDDYRICIGLPNTPEDHYGQGWCGELPGYYKDDKGNIVGHAAFNFAGEDFLIGPDANGVIRSKLNSDESCLVQMYGFFYKVPSNIDENWYDFEAIDKKEFLMKNY